MKTTTLIAILQERKKTNTKQEVDKQSFMAMNALLVFYSITTTPNTQRHFRTQDGCDLEQYWLWNGFFKASRIAFVQT